MDDGSAIIIGILIGVFYPGLFPFMVIAFITLGIYYACKYW